jgi:chlorobactene glucosyltransferase
LLLLDFLHLALLAALLGVLSHALLNLACFTGLRAATPPAEAPLVSVLVPARNEKLNIERCVRSLLAQDWPNLEILVLDDRSDDGTGALARACGEKVRVLEGAELPAGWVGKNWACHQLAQQARGAWLLFTDADTEHAPGTVSAAVALAEQVRADLLSAWPRLLTVGLAEKLVLPLIVFFGMAIYPHALLSWLQRHPWLAARLPARARRALGAANGQFLLFRRACYERIGGHAALRDHLVEDLALGRAVAARMHEGLRLVNCEALRFSQVRMYRSLGEVWEGFTKNSRAAFEDRPLGMFLFGSTQALLFLWPFAALGLALGSEAIVLAQVAIIYLIRAVLTVRFRTSWLGVVLHPFGLVLTLAIGLNSALRSTRGGVTWKGRRYTLSSG